ncbi:MAG: GGDEF domain-containing protein [Candidatus Omnitrophica bacterium]|nr:GGDEF domain-containing protein [Candidatus Omnitrophota bacterium]
MEDINLSGVQKDFLTGFYNREQLNPTLEKRISDANIHKKKFCILLVDIDHFKKINDTYGHLWGDEFLKYVSSTLRLTLQDQGVIFRYGGDEFVVVFKDPDPKKAFALAKTFNVVMRNRPFLFNGKLFRITISCGLATFPDDARDSENLMKIADKAMYYSKRYGRNMTIPANKIGLYKLKRMVSLSVKALVVFIIVGFVGSYFFKDQIKAYIPQGLGGRGFKNVIPVKFDTDTKVILKTGDVILGRKVAEDENTLVLEMAMGRGSGKITVEKSKILSIEYTK